MTYYSLDVTPLNIVWPAFLQGLGLGLVFVPLSTVAYATLERHRMAEAAGLFSLVRTIGSAIGISVVTTAARASVAGDLERARRLRLAVSRRLVAYLRRLHLQPTDPRGLAVVAREVGRQAQMGAMLDVFKVITWSYLFMVPLVFLLKRSTAQRAGATTDAAAAH